jgi:hypothetical protein
MPKRAQRPFGKIRSEFDLALLARNVIGAQVLLDELIASGRVDAGQQKCLEVRFLAGLGRQDELARNQHLISSISDLTLPAQTLIDVIDALYETYIRPNEINLNLNEVFDAFKKNIFRPFGCSLFKDRKGIRLPTVLRAFLLFELTKDSPSRKRCDLILSTYPESAEGREFALKWYDFLGNKFADEPSSILPPKSIIDKTKQALADEDYETAYNFCFELTPDYWVYSTLIRCAVELSELAVKRKILDLINSLSKEMLSNFKLKDLERIESLRTICDSTVKGATEYTWLSWANSVNNGLSLTGSNKILEENVTKWSVEEYIYEQEVCVNFARLIGNAKNAQIEIYRSAFPFLAEFFCERPNQICRMFTPIYSAIIEILALSGSLSSDELEIVSSLLLVMLSSGSSQTDYIECLEALQLIVKSNNSVIHLDWALNIAELLFLYKSEDDGNLRLTLFTDVMSIVSSSPHRVTNSQRDLLDFLAKDYGCEGLLLSLPTDNYVDDNIKNNTGFDGFIGIYTLTEAAGKRAKLLLQRYFPDARVETNNDHEATDKLKSLARNADIFVFAWKSSKHQAYFCVKDARVNKEIILPLGKGTASIVRSALERIQG